MGTDWMSDAIYKTNKFGTHSDITKVALNVKRPHDIIVYHILRQPQIEDSECKTNNGGCSHFCLPTPNMGIGLTKKVECACPDNMKLITSSQCAIADPVVDLTTKQPIEKLATTTTTTTTTAAPNKVTEEATDAHGEQPDVTKAPDAPESETVTENPGYDVKNAEQNGEDGDGDGTGVIAGIAI